MMVTMMSLLKPTGSEPTHPSSIPHTFLGLLVGGAVPIHFCHLHLGTSQFCSSFQLFPPNRLVFLLTFYFKHPLASSWDSPNLSPVSLP